MPHSSGGALTSGLFRHQPGALATRSPRVLAKDSKDCFWLHSTACRTSQDQGSNPCALQEVRRVLTTGHREVQDSSDFNTVFVTRETHAQRFLWGQNPHSEVPAESH